MAAGHKPHVAETARAAAAAAGAATPRGHPSRHRRARVLAGGAQPLPQAASSALRRQLPAALHRALGQTVATGESVRGWGVQQYNQLPVNYSDKIIQ